jgi:O-antigen ligase
MSVWLPHSSARSIRRFDLRIALWLGCLVCGLIAEGAAITQSYIWATPLICVLIAAIAIDIPLVPFIGLTLLVRVLTDATLSSANTRHTGSLNLSAGIATLFILIAAGLVVQRRRGLPQVTAITLFLCFWTIIAVRTNGASAETIREGVRELSIVALAVIVYNSRQVLSISVVTRLIQVVGVGSALLALYQLATHTGVSIGDEIRSNGTFDHPNGASMYFAIATTVSVWRYLDCGHRRSDAFFAAVFAAATISTFSLTGLAGLLAMLLAFGTLRPGSVRVKAGAYAVTALIMIAFLSTSLGAERIAIESSTRLNSGSAQNGTANTSLAERIYKWQTLIPEWEQSPFVGHGLGTTLTTEGKFEDAATGLVPHNEYLRYLVETGVIGLMSLICAVVLLIRRLAQRRRGAFGLPDAGTLGIAIIVGCLVNALADNTLLYATTGYAAALIIGAILAMPISVRTRKAVAYSAQGQPKPSPRLA